MVAVIELVGGIGDVGLRLALVVEQADRACGRLKFRVRPGSASVCLVVESGGSRCCSAVEGALAAAPRPAPPFWPAGACPSAWLTAARISPRRPRPGPRRRPRRKTPEGAQQTHRMWRGVLNLFDMSSPPARAPRSATGTGSNGDGAGWYTRKTNVRKSQSRQSPRARSACHEQARIMVRLATATIE